MDTQVRIQSAIDVESNEKSLGQMSGSRWFLRKEEVYGEGASAAYFYLLKSGFIRSFKTLSDGRRHVQSFSIPGEFFGLESGDRHFVASEAIIRSKILALPRSAFTASSVPDQSALKYILDITALELRRAQYHNLLLLRSAQERVVGFLLDMSERQQNSFDISLPMTRTDIADYLGLTIETVSRMLGKLESMSAIEIQRRRVILRKMAVLLEMFA